MNMRFKWAAFTDNTIRLKCNILFQVIIPVHRISVILCHLILTKMLTTLICSLLAYIYIHSNAAQVGHLRTHSYSLYGSSVVTHHLIPSGLARGNFGSLLPISPARALSHWVSVRCSERVRWELPQPVVLHEEEGGSAP